MQLQDYRCVLQLQQLFDMIEVYWQLSINLAWLIRASSVAAAAAVSAMDVAVGGPSCAHHYADTNEL